MHGGCARGQSRVGGGGHSDPLLPTFTCAAAPPLPMAAMFTRNHDCASTHMHTNPKPPQLYFTARLHPQHLPQQLGARVVRPGVRSRHMGVFASTSCHVCFLCFSIADSFLPSFLTGVYAQGTSRPTQDHPRVSRVPDTYILINILRFTSVAPQLDKVASSSIDSLLP